ncbi:MAG: hypothetical protein KDK97_03860 [Verrucomicrobiales bacterium]|nr:hypothetical protein [Verrucomicrobiales bacterium]MCP5557851.1 hypothetical protein [Verrucomicrobiaceae bacterium]
MTFLALRCTAVALGLVALSACSSLNGPAASYAKQRQPVEAFMKSRPEVAPLLSQYAALDQWLRVEWRRPVGPYRLAWDDGAPDGGALASHVYTTEHRFVTLHVKRNLPPADQLAGVVYEICNSRAYLRFAELMKRAANRSIARDAFVEGLLEAEIAGTRRAGQLLPRLMPLSPAERKPLQIYKACVDAPADFSQWEAWYRRHSRGGEYDVRASYGKLYDRIVTEGKTVIPTTASDMPSMQPARHRPN